MFISNSEQREILLESLIQGENFSDWGRGSGFLLRGYLSGLEASISARWRQNEDNEDGMRY